MASLFRNIIGVVTNAEVVILTATTGVKTVVFSTSFSNIDDTNKTDHYITVKVRRSATTYTRYNAVPVPYGSTFDLGKMILEPGDELRVQADANTVLHYAIDFLEKS